MLDPFELPFVQRGLIEVLLLSAGAGVLGTWIVVRGLAFYSHAVGTAAFPGLVVADGLGFAAPLGAFAAAIVFAVAVGRLARVPRASYDSTTGLALTGALALGVILASDVFHSGSNIETLLFGSLLVVDSGDLALAGAASLVAVGSTLAFGRVWLASGFDPDATRAQGVRSRLPDAALLVLVALVVIAALSALGALLAAALMVVPAATVRLWTRRMGRWQVQAVALTALEGVAGLWLSVKTNAPPGAVIAMLSGGVFAIAAIVRAVAGRVPLPGLALACVACAMPLAACGSDSDSEGASRLRVVATTTQIGDWVREVGGDDVEVHQILKANSDPHDYEPRPRDVQETADAKLVFANGDNLDEWVSKIVEEGGGNPTVVDLAGSAAVQLPGEPSGEEASAHDPHWWHDPRNAESAARKIGRSLSSADSSRRKTFERNGTGYVEKLRALDRRIAACISKVPRDRRRLVTDHDAFNYFANRYGIEVVGAVIPSQTTQAQPSAGAVSKLADLIRKEHVRAVFPESSVSPKLARALARETGAVSGFTLYGDTLGPAGSSGDTYLKMEAANADAIARGLSGGEVTCSSPLS
jgi:zinc/manganese transport system substrate-binding protein